MKEKTITIRDNKFKVGDVVYFMENNRIQKGKIIGIYNNYREHQNPNSDWFKSQTINYEIAEHPKSLFKKQEDWLTEYLNFDERDIFGSETELKNNL